MVRRLAAYLRRIVGNVPEVKSGFVVGISFGLGFWCNEGDHQRCQAGGLVRFEARTQTVSRGYGMLLRNTATSTISSPAEKFQAGEPSSKVAGFIR
jgi:RsiW-degrading membrane proteinase PrsW (M82 family)